MEDRKLYAYFRNVVDVIVKEDDAVMLNLLIELSVTLNFPSVAEGVVTIHSIKDSVRSQTISHRIDY
jgi:hypothetical protein